MQVEEIRAFIQGELCRAWIVNHPHVRNPMVIKFQNGRIVAQWDYLALFQLETSWKCVTCRGFAFFGHFGPGLAETWGRGIIIQLTDGWVYIPRPIFDFDSSLRIIEETESELLCWDELSRTFSKFDRNGFLIGEFKVNSSMDAGIRTSIHDVKNYRFVAPLSQSHHRIVPVSETLYIRGVVSVEFIRMCRFLLQCFKRTPLRKCKWIALMICSMS